jgi:hypothetical protein
MSGFWIAFSGASQGEECPVDSLDVSILRIFSLKINSKMALKP